MRFFCRFPLGLIATLATGFMAPLHAAPEMALNLVWTRVADVNGEAGSVESAEFSPDGRSIVTGAKFDNSVIMWRTSDGAELWRTYVGAEVERVGWSPDGKVVASCSEDSLVTIFDAATGKVIKTIPHRNGIDALTWSKNGRWLATGEEHVADATGRRSAMVRLFKMPEAVVEREADFGNTVNELAFTSDDRFLVAAGHAGTVKIYATADLSLVREIKCDPAFNQVCVDLTPDDKYIATAGFGGMIWVFELATGKLVKKFNQTGRKIETLAWSRDGQYLFTAGHDPSIFVSRTADILDAKRPQIFPIYRSPKTDNMEYINVSPNGAFLASAHQDGMVRLWVFLNDDPDFNAKRHAWVSEQQRRQFSNGSQPASAPKR